MRMIGLGNIFCIYYVIFKSKRTIDVCVPRLSSDALAKCLVKVQQQNGSKTRIIIHKSNDLRNLQLFTLNRIEVKLIKSEVRLEHEFIVIDSSEPNAMILLGNVCCGGCWDKMECFNKAPTILSSEKSLVGVMKQEFDRIWNSELY
ncbi:uncharacterized protein LOC114250916 [Bombyx mandarina]|uniref:Uncharacterized protein LOC114250916 n=1 Tax=Bombyx mandarina TaxID=7092 RepID=A0A6J2KKY9_BOMMA|nr:uncharacterized protein LOC114250916 [Bombyx mandarina]